MPSGYTYKSRIGWVRTAPALAQLMGTWQLGRRIQYVLGLAQTTTSLPVIASGLSGNIATPVWTAFSILNFVPPTASEIHLAVATGITTGGIIVAPNNNYGGNGAAVNMPPIMMNGGGTIAMNQTILATLLLESTNIYYATSTALPVLQAMGWTDNL